MRHWLIRLLIIFLFLSMATEAGAQGSGVIEGQVSNGTSSEGEPLGGLLVTLWISRGEEDESSLQVTTDEEGRFHFEGLDTDGYSYQFVVEYQGIDYGSELMAFPEGEDVLSVPFAVFEPTTSDADLWIERAHLIVDLQPGFMLVQEVQIFVNGGNKTYIGSTGEEGAATLHFPLPQGVSGVQLIEGLMSCCVVETEMGIASDRPIFPGVEQFVFTYEVEHQSSAYSFAKEIAYPINSLDVMVTDVGAEVIAPGLTVEEPISSEGGRYLHLTGQNLTPADDPTLEFTNLPLETGERTPTPDSAAGSGVFQWVVVGVVALGVFLALGYPFLRKRQEEKD
jgi:hypothetical protein